MCIRDSGQGSVIRRIGGRGHFRSRDENGDQTIRSAIPENPMLYVNFTALSSIDLELFPIEVLHCRNSEFRVFLRKIVENIYIFCLYRTSDADDAETHFLVHYRQFQLVCCRSYTHLRCHFTLNRLVWSLPVTWQRWRSHYSIRSCRKPPAIRKLYGSIFYRTEVIAHWFFCIVGIGNFAYFCEKIMENIIFPICVAK